MRVISGSVCALVFLFCNCPSRCYGQNQELKFKHFTKAEGLSGSNITCIGQTADGYLWIGTTDGLNKFDGYSFHTYKNDPLDSTSIADNTISALLVDSDNNLWIGTPENGLSRYVPNRNNFENYNSVASNNQSLSSNYITSIIEDREKNIWIGTSKGLNKFIPTTKTFQRYFHQVEIEIQPSTRDSLIREKAPTNIIQAVAALIHHNFSTEERLYNALRVTLNETDVSRYAKMIMKHALIKVTADQIQAMDADDQGNLWLACNNTNGLSSFNPNTNMVTIFKDGFHTKTITSLRCDHTKVWIGMSDGTVGFMHDDTFSELHLAVRTYNISAIIKDHRGNVWLGDDYGLCRTNDDGTETTRYQSEENNIYSLGTTAAKTIFEDDQNNIWTGSAQGGLSLTLSNMPFDLYQHQVNVTNSLAANSVSSVLEDPDGNIWIGFFTMGVDYWDRGTNKITHYAYDEQNTNGIGKGTVFAITEDSQGKVWFGTYEGGLQYFDKDANGFVTFKHRDKDPTSLEGNDVRAIAADKAGNLWLAIHGHGITRFNSETHATKTYHADYDHWQNTIANDWTFTTYVDAHGNVWAGSVDGVSVLYQNAKNFVTYNRSNSNLSHNRVRTFLEDQHGAMWVGTENGLNRFDSKTKTFTLYSGRNGLANNNIKGLLQDSVGDLWISTDHGLSRFAITTGKTLNFTTTDGLQLGAFFSGAYASGKNDKLYFGGENGLNIFSPENVIVDTTPVPVHLTTLSLFNKPINADTRILDGPLDEAVQLTFTSEENVFSIAYVAITFKHAEKIKYAYLLEGFESEWNYVDNKREATYTNLDAGTYTFKVRASNIDGTWLDNSKSISIVVLPPWWKTPLAFSLYLLALLALLYAAITTNVNRNTLKNKIALQKLEDDKVHEMDSLKLRFFTNISHEFRTPLTLIHGPAETLLQQGLSMEADRRHHYYQLIFSNAQRLLRLINQLLDISALDAGVMKLRVGQHDVANFCSSIAEAFVYRAEKASIQYTFTTNIAQAYVYFDYDKVEKIVYNLIANAIKFTPQGGQVSVAIAMTDQHDEDLPTSIVLPNLHDIEFVRITIRDNGIGVPAHLTTKVFERFYQAENNHDKRNGTGIGLALALQLAEKHYGTITLKSDLGTGCCFTVWLPVSRCRFSESEISGTVAPSLRTEMDIALSYTPQSEMATQHDLTSDRPSILVVDDSEDIRAYLALNLSDEYLIHQASNGLEAFEKALESNIDLIISDVIMPACSGFELCQKIKNDAKTSHIPVVLLTARTAERYELEGLKTGAEDYITKPFSLPVLKARIKNIIDVRQKIRDRFYSDLNFDPKNIASNSLDKGFVQHLIATIEANLTDENFNPDIFAETMHISRSQLYKKVKGLTGLSVSIFVRNIRLRKAGEMLKDNSLSISEIAYAVGFSDPGYFTKCFREMYARSPKEYQSIIQTISTNP